MKKKFNRFCTVCGRTMSQKKYTVSYDAVTGEPLERIKFLCPKFRSDVFFKKHDQFTLSLPEYDEIATESVE